MAEGVLKYGLQRVFKGQNRHFEVESRGLIACDGRPPDRKAIEIMRDRGIHIGEHRSRQLKSADVHWADLVLVMEDVQRAEVARKAGRRHDSVFRFGEHQDTDIEDPYGCTREVFTRVLDTIELGAANWIDEIVRSDNRTQTLTLKRKRT